MNRFRIAFSLVALTLTLGLSGCVIIPIMPPSQDLREVTVRPGKGLAPKKILLMDIEGTIRSQGGGGFFGGPGMLADLDEQLKHAAQDHSIKAIVLRVNSPGGGVTATDMIYKRFIKFREETDIPIYVAMMDMAASGGYYISMAADKIYATPTSLTGSIGVIAFFPEGEGLMSKIGVRVEAVKSGASKDAGSLFRRMTAEERQIFEGIINSMFERFLEAVEQGRPALAPEKIRELADGRVYTAPQALEAGLIDGVAYLDEVLDTAGRENGAKHAKVVAYRRGWGAVASIYETSAEASASAARREAHPAAPWAGAPDAAGRNLQVNLLNLQNPLESAAPHSPVFQYLWVP